MDWLQWLVLLISIPGAFLNILLILQTVKTLREKDKQKQ